MSKRNNQSFQARQQQARRLARAARAGHDLWLLREVAEYARSGVVGPTLRSVLDWHLGRSDALPQASLGSLAAWDASHA